MEFEGAWRLGAVEVCDVYPGMSRTESEIWSRWLMLHVGELSGVCYSVRVGEGGPCPVRGPDWLVRDWLLLTQLRVDAVVGWQGGLWVVEVKSRQSMSGLGQCLSYGLLLVEAWGLVLAPRMLHVVGMAQPDLGRPFASAGVMVEVV